VPPGSVTLRSITMAASAGLAMAAAPSLTRSAAVASVPLSKPLGSVMMVWVIPMVWAAVFSSATNEGTEPATHVASVAAMLLPDGSISASSNLRSVNCSPWETNVAEPPDETALL
jgi:hypothetical protein